MHTILEMVISGLCMLANLKDRIIKFYIRIKMILKPLVSLFSDPSSLWRAAVGSPRNSSGRSALRQSRQPTALGGVVGHRFVGSYLRRRQKPGGEVGGVVFWREDGSQFWVLLQTILGHRTVVSWLRTLLCFYCNQQHLESADVCRGKSLSRVRIQMTAKI